MGWALVILFALLAIVGGGLLVYSLFDNAEWVQITGWFLFGIATIWLVLALLQQFHIIQNFANFLVGPHLVGESFFASLAFAAAFAFT